MRTFLQRRESDEEWDVFVCLGSCLHSVWNYPHEKKGKMPGWNTMKFILTQRMNYAWKGHKSPECLMYRLRRTSSAVLTRWPRNSLDLEHNSFSFSLLSILVSVKLTQIMFKKFPISDFPKTQRMCQSGKRVSLFMSCMSKACRQNCPCSSHCVKSQFLEPLSILIDSGVSGFSCD